MAKPPLIVLMADQLRCDALGAYGSAGTPGESATPKIDQLAQRSTVFSRHFTPAPLCVPARTSMMTGLPPFKHGAIINGWRPQDKQHGMLNGGVELLPARLAEAGYRVAHVGVQHIHTAPPLQNQLAEVEFVGPMSVGDHYRQLTDRGLMLGDMSIFREPVVDYDGGVPVVATATNARTEMYPLREDLFYDSVLADQMVRVIEEHDGSRPLALFGMFWLPHPPLWAPQKWATRFDPASIHLPANVGHWYKGQPVMQLDNIPGRLGAHVPVEHWRRVWAMYLGMVSLLDHCVGRVLKALRDQGMIDDAAIIFTSDHGEMLGSHAMYQKMCLYDEAIHVPLMIKLPKQESSRHVSELTDHLDLTATLTDIAHIKPMTKAFGQSLLPWASGKRTEAGGSTNGRNAVFAGYDGNGGRGFAHRMIRTSTHKFIYNLNDRNELYDLIEDPRETINLAGNEDVGPIESHLRNELSDWMDRVDDDLPRCRPKSAWLR